MNGDQVAQFVSADARRKSWVQLASFLLRLIPSVDSRQANLGYRR